MRPMAIIPSGAEVNSIIYGGTTKIISLDPSSGWEKHQIVSFKNKVTGKCVVIDDGFWGNCGKIYDPCEMERNMLWRSLKGAALGAALTTTVAVTMTALLFGCQIIVSAAPIDRANDLRHLWKVLPIAVLAGVIVGVVGGIAAKLPRTGVRMITSIGIVAGCAAVTRLFAVTQPRFKGSPEPSYIPVIIAALVAGALVLVYGIIVTRKEVTCKPPAKSSDP